MKKKIICIRKYELLDEIYKQEMDLKLFEDEIREAYEEVVDKRVEILVYPKSYLVIGSITPVELRKAGGSSAKILKLENAVKDAVRATDWLREQDSSKSQSNSFKIYIIFLRRMKTHDQ